MPTNFNSEDATWSWRPSRWSPTQRRKAISLAVLAVQNSALTLTMRYSRTRRTGTATYLASEAVVMSELFKAVVSLSFAALVLDDAAVDDDDDDDAGRCGERSSTTISPEEDRQNGQRRRASFAAKLGTAARQAYAEPRSYVLLVPAALYAVQNNLQYVAASNLEPAVFQLLYQMKLLTTALFSVVLLRRRLSKGQWTAVALLALGLGLASVGSSPHRVSSGAAASRPHAAVNFGVGFAAVFAACCSSGFSSVYFERVVKTRATACASARTPKTPISVWARNAQLATFSSTIAALGAVVKDGDAIRKRGRLLVGFSPLVWTVVALQAGGGLCTAAVIAYADNLLKGFATGISMLASVLASAVWFDFRITPHFLLGAAAVVGAIVLYALQ